MNAAVGGAALSTLALIDRLRQVGIESSAICHDVGGAEDRRALEDATRGHVRFVSLYWWNKKTRAEPWKRPLIELRQLAKTGAGVRSTIDVARFAREERVDLIHTNTMVTKEGARAAMLLGLPHVWHVRELVGKGRHCELPISDERLERYLVRRASVVIANSNVTASCFSGRARSLVRVVPNGIDLSRFLPRSSLRPHDKRVVAMVGHITARNKKHALFIRAASMVNAKGVEFRIYGHIPERGGGTSYAGELESLQRTLGLEDRISWPGFMPAESIMPAIDVLVQPADNESFGRVIVEAMASHVPVVGANGGGAGELIQDEKTGLLFSPDDAAALARALDRLLADPELCARMGSEGRRRAEACYSIETYVSGIVDAYRAAMMRPLRRGLLEPAGVWS
jgi:glycosyltransferase involved in cell wall biosynthesis